MNEAPWSEEDPLPTAHQLDVEDEAIGLGTGVGGGTSRLDDDRQQPDRAPSDLFDEESTGNSEFTDESGEEEQEEADSEDASVGFAADVA